nr:hypothetical protein [Tanacetum cinerariifolium]
MPCECLAIIKSKSKVHYSRNKPVVAQVNTNTSTFGISPDVAELKDMVKVLLLDKKSQSPAPVKAVEESCVTCGGAHSYRNCPATDGNGNNFNQGPIYQPAVYQPPAYQALAYQAPAPQTQGVSKEDFSADIKVVENEPEATKDTVNPTNNGSTEDVQPQVVQSEYLVLSSEAVTSLISEPMISSVSASMPNRKSSIPYPSRRNDERNHEKAKNQIGKFYQIFKDMSFEISFADALILMTKFASTLKALIGNKKKLSEMARTLLNEHCFAVLLKKLPKNWETQAKLADHSISYLVGVTEDVYVKEGMGFFDAISSGNPTSYYDPIVSMTSLNLTPFENSDLLLEEVDAFLKDDPTLPEVDQSYFDSEGDILLLEAFLNNDP